MAPTINIVRTEALEGGYIRFKVSLSAPSTEEVRIDYRAVEGTAKDSPLNFTDYSVYKGNGSIFRVDTLVIPAGQTEAEIVVRLKDDRIDEVDESFWIELFNPVGATLADNPPVHRVLGIAKDGDGTGSNLAMFVSSPVIVEGDGGTRRAVFEVHLSEAQDSVMEFDYRTANGSALAGSDFVAKSGKVTFAAGETTARVAIDIVEDGTSELNEFFSLVVTPTSAIKNGFDGSAGIASILDDDTVGDGLPIVSIQRADQTEGGTMRFRVVLSQATDDEVRINYRTVAGTATDAPANNRDHAPKSGTLAIAAGDQVGFIEIKANQDNLDEVDESIWLELYDPTNARFAGAQKIERVLGIVQDDDGTGTNLSLFVTSPTIREGDSGSRQAVFEVHLSEAYDKNLTIQFKTSDSSARSGSDYVAKTGSVTFLAGQIVAAVAVELVEDGRLEGDETFSLLLTPPAGNIIKNGAATHAGRATIANDDDIHEVIEGNSGNNLLSGGTGNDRIYGYDGNDTLNGGSGNDRLEGQNGIDKLLGGSGIDSLLGGRGKDTLEGGAGADKLTGGVDADTFLFRAIGESTVGASGQDRIYDFKRSEGDNISLTAIDAKTATSANDKFAFINDDAFHKKAGELRAYTKNGDTVVAGDVTGDGKADFAIVLEGALTLRSSDFIL